jgi:hypothetical protein
MLANLGGLSQNLVRTSYDHSYLKGSYQRTYNTMYGFISEINVPDWIFNRKMDVRSFREYQPKVINLQHTLDGLSYFGM